MNWLIKQIFYIRYFVLKQGNDESPHGEFESVNLLAKYLGEIETFYSKSFTDGQWKASDKSNEWISLFSQQYGLWYFNALMNGLITKGIWPALWLYEEKSKSDVELGLSDHSYYYEIDWELDEQMKDFFAINIHINHNGGQNEPGYKKLSSKFRSKRFQRNLQEDFHLFLIDWNEEWIRFYINGILCARFRNEIHVPMKIIISKSSIQKVVVEK